MAISAAFMACIVLGYYFLSLAPAQKTLRLAGKRLGRSVGEPNGPLDVAVPESSTRISSDWILRVSKPRTVLVSWHKAARRFANRVFAGGAALAIFSVFFLATIRGDFLRARTAFLVIGLVFLFILAFRIRGEFKSYRLLQNGEVAIGHILSQKRSGEWKLSSKITYEFEDRIGELGSGTATDLTEMLYEGMPALVFYDSERNVEPVALCETFFGIAVEDGTSILDS